MMLKGNSQVSCDPSLCISKDYRCHRNWSEPLRQQIGRYKSMNPELDPKALAAKPELMTLYQLQFNLGNGFQLIFLPVPNEAGGAHEPFDRVLLGFHVVKDSWKPLLNSLARNRLPLVLDIDETLVVAYTIHGLTKRLTDAKRKRSTYQRDWTNASIVEKPELAKAVHAAEKEEQFLEDDLGMLQQFMDTDCATAQGELYQATMEYVSPNMHRPVLRIMKHSCILTRIDPEDPNTSMLIRLRPGWEELKRGIMGLDSRSPPRLKFDVYICTTAMRDYALEVWRLLDSHSELIERERVAQRMVNVPQGRMKRLSDAFKIGPIDSEDASPLPFAIIADDRHDVWVGSARDQLLNVEPYAPYRRVADLEYCALTLKQHPADIPWLSLKPLLAQIQAIRSYFFFDLETILNASLSSQHVPEKRQLVWPRIRTLAELIKDIRLGKAGSMQLDAVAGKRSSGKPDIIVRVPSWDHPLSKRAKRRIRKEEWRIAARSRQDLAEATQQALTLRGSHDAATNSGDEVMETDATQDYSLESLDPGNEEARHCLPRSNTDAGRSHHNEMEGHGRGRSRTGPGNRGRRMRVRKRQRRSPASGVSQGTPQNPYDGEQGQSHEREDPSADRDWRHPGDNMASSQPARAPQGGSGPSSSERNRGNTRGNFRGRYRGGGSYGSRFSRTGRDAWRGPHTTQQRGRKSRKQYNRQAIQRERADSEGGGRQVRHGRDFDTRQQGQVQGQQDSGFEPGNLRDTLASIGGI